jgi:NAD(P)-dependent dehydrogenase (short-subunit alcohol dehydrogenase family)
LQLEDQVALITGGSAGIGRATAELFAREGAAVVIAARSTSIGEQTAADIEQEGGTALFVRCDVRRADDCQRAVDMTVERFGYLHILFNNAGIVARGRVDNTDEDTWGRVMDTNVTGVFLMSRAAIPVMQRQKRGVIINNASDAGLVGEKNMAAYCASKGAVVLLTKAMALDYASEGIRVNALCPGPHFVERWERRAAAGGRDVEEDIRFFASDVPLGRVSSAEELAPAALFLASDASAFMTGTTLVVDGGRTAM